MKNPPTPVFLEWIAARLVNTYLVNENTDFVLRLREEAARAYTLRTNLSQNVNTFVLVEVNGPRASDGKSGYAINLRGKANRIGTRMWLSEQDADDLSRQLDAPIDYFND